MNLTDILSVKVTVKNKVLFIFIAAFAIGISCSMGLNWLCGEPLELNPLEIEVEDDVVEELPVVKAVEVLVGDADASFSGGRGVHHQPGTNQEAGDRETRDRDQSTVRRREEDTKYQTNKENTQKQSPTNRNPV